MGIRLGEFSHRAEAYFVRILAGREPYNHDIARFPYLILDMPADAGEDDPAA